MNRNYTEADRQYFADYIEHRARYRPLECCGGIDCWVDFGPPAMSSTRGTARTLCCVGCSGTPVIQRAQGPVP